MALSVGRGCPGPPPRSPHLTAPLGDDDQSPRGQARQPRFDEIFHSDGSHGIDAGGRSAGRGEYKGGGVLRDWPPLAPRAYLLEEAPSYPHQLACQDPAQPKGRGLGNRILQEQRRGPPPHSPCRPEIPSREQGHP